MFDLHYFALYLGVGICEVGGFEFKAPTTCRNALRVLRAMQLPKPGMFLHLHLNFLCLCGKFLIFMIRFF